MIAREKTTIANFEAFLALPENAEKHFELFDGAIYEMTPTSELPGIINMRLSARLQLFIEENSLGLLTSPENGFQLSPLDMLAPDAAFIASGRLKGLRKRGFFQIAPDLAVEVISPSDSVTAVQRKAARYLALGVREVWIIYPSEGRADVCRPDPSGESDMRVKQLNKGDAFEGGDLLPNFRLPLATLFDVGLPILDDEADTEADAAPSER
ncbi:MAG: Uma2 family endonuclease [Chloroflexi bacterium CFX4]|nr:Uma2 family endonuclease [Chloroflexi bacterium CFX4]